MFTRRFIHGTTSISRFAVIKSRNLRLVKLPCCRTPAWTSLSREYHHDGSLKAMGETAAREQVTLNGTERQKVKETSGLDAGKGVGAGNEAQKEDNGEEKAGKKRKTIAEMDEELKAKMEGREGAAGISYEGGKPVTDGFGRGKNKNGESCERFKKEYRNLSIIMEEEKMEEAGAGCDDLFQTKTIDYAYMGEDKAPTESREKRKRVDSAHDAAPEDDSEREGNLEEARRLSDLRYEDMVAHSKVQRKQDVDLNEVSKRLKRTVPFDRRVQEEPKWNNPFSSNASIAPFGVAPLCLSAGIVPSGPLTVPSGAVTVPSGVAPLSLGAGIVPSGAVTDPFGAGTIPFGAVTDPFGAGTISSGAVTDPFGAGTISSGAVTVPSGAVTIPSRAAKLLPGILTGSNGQKPSLNERKGNKTPKIPLAILNDPDVFPLRRTVPNNQLNADNQDDTINKSHTQDDDTAKQEDLGGDRIQEANAVEVSKEVKKSNITDNMIDVPNDTKSNKTIVADSQGKELMPSSILERGIIYWFYDPRLGKDGEPEGIEGAGPIYFVLRSLLHGGRIAQLPILHIGTARLLTIPKQTWPEIKQDKLLCIVNKARKWMKDVSDNLWRSYNLPPGTHFQEGLYTISSNGRESHLSYHVTYPEIPPTQGLSGIKKQGSYVCLIKNPKAPGPANSTHDTFPGYPEELQNKFGELGWLPMAPEHLTFEGTQMLIIGEGLWEVKKEEGRNSPEGEDMSKLIDKDHDCVKGLKEDDFIFEDLKSRVEEYALTGEIWET
ncbi:hypothetical protein NHQ30_010085 [Ciborinia camelliae]|nr:hypothetical protein NHQ30_010085 [Ciborinia camelliae]